MPLAESADDRMPVRDAAVRRTAVRRTAVVGPDRERRTRFRTICPRDSTGTAHAVLIVDPGACNPSGVALTLHNAWDRSSPRAAISAPIPPCA